MRLRLVLGQFELTFELYMIINAFCMIKIVLKPYTINQKQINENKNEYLTCCN